MVRSVRNALIILEELARNQPIGTSELARTIGMAKSSVFRILLTMEEAGWVRSNDGSNAGWTLSHRVFSIGLAAPATSNLREAAVKEMHALRDMYGETCYLSVPEGDGLVVVERVDGRNALRSYVELGAKIALSTTASGRAFLSALPDDEAKRLMERDRDSGIWPMKLSREALWEELLRCRDRSYSLDDGGGRMGGGAAIVLGEDDDHDPPASNRSVAAVAAPVVNSLGSVVAVITLAMPAGRLSEIGQSNAGSRVASACARVASACG
jgi:IclR family acetate operon transcriptional repressor